MQTEHMPTAVFRDDLATILVIGIGLSCVAELAARVLIREFISDLNRKVNK